MRNNPPVRLRTERKHLEREGKIWGLTAQTVYHIQAAGTHLSPWDILYVYAFHWCSLFSFFRAAGRRDFLLPSASLLIGLWGKSVAFEVQWCFKADWKHWWLARWMNWISDWRSSSMIHLLFEVIISMLRCCKRSWTQLSSSWWHSSVIFQVMTVAREGSHFHCYMNENVKVYDCL